MEIYGDMGNYGPEKTDLDSFHATYRCCADCRIAPQKFSWNLQKCLRKSGFQNPSSQVLLENFLPWPLEGALTFNPLNTSVAFIWKTEQSKSIDLFLYEGSTGISWVNLYHTCLI